MTGIGSPINAKNEKINNFLSKSVRKFGKMVAPLLTFEILGLN